MLAVRPLPSGDDHGAARGVPGGAPAGGVQGRRRSCSHTCGPDRHWGPRPLVDPARVLRRTTALNWNLMQNDQTHDLKHFGVEESMLWVLTVLNHV